MTDRSLSAKVARLLLIRRGMKKLEERNNELRDEIIEEMKTKKLGKINVPSGKATLYAQWPESIDSVELFDRYGKDALAVMSVKIGEAKKTWGELTLRDENLILDHGYIARLLTRPAPKKKVLKVAC